MSRHADQENFAYRALADELRAAIRSGRVGDGGQLPTEAELVAEQGVSRQTVRRAMQELVAEGLVYRVRGRGTFAAAGDGRLLRQFGSVEDLLSLSDDTTLEVIEPLHRGVDIEAAGRLDLSSDVVYVLSYRRLFQDASISYTRAHLPPNVAEKLSGLPELQTAGATTLASSTVIGLIEEHAGVRIMAADQSITVGRMPEPFAAVVECEPAAPWLRVDRLYRDAADHPVELAISWWNPSLYTYRVRLQRR